MKKKKKKIKRYSIFFNDYNGYGVYDIIFSFVETNKDVISFAYCNKELYKTFWRMAELHSTVIYQYKFLNNKSRKDHSLDVFSQGLDTKCSKYFCKNVEEYTRRMTNNLGNIFEITENYMIQVLTKINQKYGMVAMVAGGKTLQFLSTNNLWTKFKSYYNDMFVGKFYPYFLNECTEDIDIFLLGKNKIQIAKEIIKEFEIIISKKKHLKCSLTYKIGVIDLNTDLCKYGWSYMHLTLKENVTTPNDVFCMFDLDCCKIGWFPGLKKVLCSFDFIRAIKTTVNYSPSINNSRVLKYYNRTKIKTLLCNPPLLSYYHTNKFCSVIYKNALDGSETKEPKRKKAPHCNNHRDMSYRLGYHYSNEVAYIDPKCNDSREYSSRAHLNFESEIIKYLKNPKKLRKKYKQWHRLPIQEQKLQAYYYNAIGWNKDKNGKFYKKRIYKKRKQNI